MYIYVYVDISTHPRACMYAHVHTSSTFKLLVSVLSMTPPVPQTVRHASNARTGSASGRGVGVQRWPRCLRLPAYKRTRAHTHKYTLTDRHTHIHTHTHTAHTVQLC